MSDPASPPASRRPRRSWKRFLFGEWSWKRPIKSLVAIYFMLTVIAVFFADRLIFIPPPTSYDASLEGFITLRTEAGESIAAVHHPAKPGRPTLLYSHGNAEDLGDSLFLYDLWRGEGFGVLAYDYPGYGLSSGTSTEASVKQAIQAAWNYLIEQGVSGSSIVIVGRSVGGGPSTWLASQEQPAGLVLIATFTSTFAVPFPVPIFPRDRFTNLSHVRSLERPLLVIHGENDEVIAPRHGQALFDASPARDKTLIRIPAAGHNDLFLVAEDQIVGAIREFALRVAADPGPDQGAATSSP